MRKVIVGLLTLAMVFFMANIGFAESDSASGSGWFDIGVDAEQSVSGGGLTGSSVDDGYAMSGYVANGEAKSDASEGVFFWREASGDVGATGGALGTSQEIGIDNPDMVGSYSFSQGITGGSVNTDSYGLGFAGGEMSGSTFEGTGAISSLGVENGNTVGITGQMAYGSFSGFSGSAFGWGSVDTSAHIDVSGESYSVSTRKVTENYTGIRTDVHSSTELSSGKTGCASGGWNIGGVASTVTSQNAPGGNGNAHASATGSYHGTGNLGDNYTGSATGYSQTSTTEVEDLDGSVNRASAGMEVHSKSE